MSKYQETTKRLVDVSRVYQRGKTQVPSLIRKMLGVKDGDRISWFSEQGKIIIERA